MNFSIRRCFYHVMLSFLCFPLSLSGQGSFLTLKEWERNTIDKLVSTIGQERWFSLLLKSRNLNKMGNSIRHVPPLQFLAFVVSRPHLKNHLRTISKDSLKWSSFMSGLSSSLRKDSSIMLQTKIVDFASFLRLDPAPLYRLIHQRRWTEFTLYVLNHAR